MGPLKQKDLTGVTTGYRWLIPASRDGDAPTVWSKLASVMNSSVACMLGHDRFNHAWGGSMALRAETAMRGDLRSRLTGALCDDYQFSRLSRDLGLRVYYVPQCLVATPVDFDLSGLINFGHRQYLLTRVYAPKLFVAALAITTLYVLAWNTAWWWLTTELWNHPASGAWVWPAGVLVISTLTDLARASLRQKVTAEAFDQQTITQLQPTIHLDRFATPQWMTLHWLLILRSVFGRTMRWRGITYRLYGPQRVERI